MKNIFLLFVLMHTVLFAVSDTRGLVIPGTLKVNGTSMGKVKDFGTYHALLIYVEEYDNLQNLKTPKKDVEAIADILKNRYGFKEIKIVRNPKNRDALIEILDDLQRKLNEDDNLLIYYAGHGNKEGFWQLSSARKNSRVGWIPLAQAVNYTLNKIRSRHILVVADSCYAGMLTRESGSMSSLSPEDKKYYTKLNQIKSRNVLTGGGFQPVIDEDSVNPNHSVFANGFLEMLKNNNKAVFAMDEQYAKVKRYVQLNTQDQMPLYGDVRRTGHQDGGDFIFIDQSVLKEQGKVKETTQTTLTPKTSSEQPLVNDVKIEKKEEKPRPPSLYALSIKPTPTDAKIQIMNITPRYKEGMKLKKGKYHIRVSKRGYVTKNVSITLEENTQKKIKLEKQKQNRDGITTIGNKMWQDEPYTKAEKKAYYYYTNKKIGKVRDWQGAKKYCYSLTLGGYSDWRLPTKNELKNLYKHVGKLRNVVSNGYWSSTTVVGNEGNAWSVGFDGGFDFWDNKSYSIYVRCVRDGQ